MITTDYSCPIYAACLRDDGTRHRTGRDARDAGRPRRANPRVSYVCQVRAKASIGYGPWSRGTKLAG